MATTKIAKRPLTDQQHYDSALSNQYANVHLLDACVPPYPECILPMGTPHGPVAPIFGFVPRMGNLKAVQLDLLTDVYNILDTSITAGEIAAALAAPGITDLEFVYGASPYGKLRHLQSIPMVSWVFDSERKRFCRFADDTRVGIEIPMSDYTWTGLNTLGRRVTMRVEKLSVKGNQHRKTLRLHLSLFQAVDVVSNDRPPAWSIYYRGATNHSSKETVEVDVFEFNRRGESAPLGRVRVISNKVPRYLVDHRTGNVYQLFKAETTYLKVAHIGYVPPSVVVGREKESRFYSTEE